VVLSLVPVVPAAIVVGVTLPLAAVGLVEGVVEANLFPEVGEVLAVD